MNESIKAIVRQVIKEELAPSPYATVTDPAYAGGNPKTTEGGSAGVERSYVSLPFTTRQPAASQPVTKQSNGNDKVTQGVVALLHDGLPVQHSYWWLPVQHPTTETTINSQSEAIRQKCTQSVFVTKAQIRVTAAQASSLGTVKIYSGDGVLIWTSNTIDTSGTGNVLSAAATGIWLNSGYDYIIEYTNNTAGVTLVSTAYSTNGATFSNQNAAQRAGTAAAIVANSPVNTASFPWIILTS